jgi:hypothetical protein
MQCLHAIAKNMQRRAHHETRFLSGECDSVNAGVSGAFRVVAILTVQIEPVLILQSGFALMHALHDDEAIHKC